MADCANDHSRIDQSINWEGDQDCQVGILLAPRCPIQDFILGQQDHNQGSQATKSLQNGPFFCVLEHIFAADQNLECRCENKHAEDDLFECE